MEAGGRECETTTPMETRVRDEHRQIHSPLELRAHFPLPRRLSHSRTVHSAPSPEPTSDPRRSLLTPTSLVVAGEVREGDSHVDVQQLAEDLLRDPSDGLEILVRTSPPTGHHADDDDDDDDDDVDVDVDEHEVDDDDYDEAGSASREDGRAVGENPGSPMLEGVDTSQAVKNINNFPLVRLGFVAAADLRNYVSIFIRHHHHYFPIIPEYRLPHDDGSLGRFASEEPFLLMSIVLIVSRCEKASVHAACWKFARCHLSGITHGGLPTVGMIEGLLLLSEHLPKLPKTAVHKLHSVEAFMSWNLVGLAVRFGYFLGLEQKALLNPHQVYDEQTSRERLAWTYCCISDRQMSIRLGKTLRSRGPPLSSQPPPQADLHIRMAAHHNFPPAPVKEGGGNIEDSPTGEETTAGDYSTLVQAYVELTVMITNIHDTLYASRQRTTALAQSGEYYCMLDELTRTLTCFCIAWEDQHRWRSLPLHETLWLTFYYTKLYACSFAFQAHVQRSMAKTKPKSGSSKTSQSAGAVRSEPSLAKLVVFPHGVHGTRDAKFILAAMDAASELLKICVDDIFPSGALAALPSRFYGYFIYAAVFLLKVVLTEAVGVRDKGRLLTLVGRTITALVSVPSKVDKQHLSVRSGLQLRTLFRTLVANMDAYLAPEATPLQDSSASTEPQPAPDVVLSSEAYPIWLDEMQITAMMEPVVSTSGPVADPMGDVSWSAEPYMQDFSALLDNDIWLSMLLHDEGNGDPA